MKNQTVPTKLRSGDEVIVIAGKDIGKKALTWLIEMKFFQAQSKLMINSKLIKNL